MDGAQENSKPTTFLYRIVAEIGLASLYRSTLDTKLLIIQRFVRLFAYGASTIILVPYLSVLGFSDTRIGLFMTLTLVGDVVISFLLTLITDGIGRRWMLALGAILMAASGVIFGLVGNYWVLLIAAIVGIISPSGNEIGPFRAIEESTLAHLSSASVRPDIFAWYSLFGSAGAAFGMMTCGWIVTALHSSSRWSKVRAYQVIFLAYGAIGLVKLALALCLSPKCEADRPVPAPPSRDSEQAPLLANPEAPPPQQKKTRRSLLPHISKESRSIFVKLVLLFSLDSFASGLAPLTWTTTFFGRKFGLKEGYLGSLFFTTSIIAALSVLVAASLARRIGNVKTMVFTHLPSAVCLALLGLPSQLPLAMALLIFRACTQTMDVAPRSAFLAAVILPHERTAIMGSINVFKTAAQSIGPAITGLLVGRNLFWVAFLMAGSLKAVYDISILAVFVNHQTREEREAREEDGEDARVSNESASQREQR